MDLTAAQCIRNGDTQHLSSLLVGISNSTLEDYVCDAIRLEKIEILQILLHVCDEKKTDITSFDRPIVLRAVVERSKEMVELLCKAGADVNGGRNYTEPPLIAAARRGFLDIAKILLKNKADTTVTHEGKGLTALVYAFLKNDVDMVKLLLDYSPMLHGEMLERVFSHVCSQYFGNVELATILIDIMGANVNNNQYIDNSLTPLGVACRTGYSDIVKLLVDKGADVNKFSDGSSPLWHAVLSLGQNPWLCAKILLEAGANPSVRCPGSCNQETAVHAVVTRGYANLLEQFVNKFPDCIVVKNRYGQMPIFSIPVEDFEKVLKIVFCSKANFENIDYIGTNPLLHYCKEGHAEVVKALIDHIPLNETDNMDQGVLHYCVRGEEEKTIVVLKLLLDMADSEVDIYAKDANGQTALHLACLFDRTKLVKLLIEKGASATEKNRCNLLPLDFAASRDIYDLIHQRTSPCSDVEKAESVFEYRQKSRIDACEQLKPPIFKSEEELYDWVKKLLTADNVGAISLIPEGSAKQEVKQIDHAIDTLMTRIAQFISNKDPYMKCEIHLAGSNVERTKVGLPDEYDYGLWLTELQKYMRMPTEFHLNRSLARICCTDDIPNEIKDLFENGVLVKPMLCQRFYILASQALNHPTTWEDLNLFRKTGNDITSINQNISNVNLIWHGHVYKWLPLSVDMVPTVPLSSWPQFIQKPRVQISTPPMTIVAKSVLGIPPEDDKFLFTLSSPLESTIVSMLPVESRLGYVLTKILRNKHLAKAKDTKLVEILKFSTMYDNITLVRSYMFKTCLLHELEQTSILHLLDQASGEAEEWCNYSIAEVVTWARKILTRLQKALESRMLDSYIISGHNVLERYFKMDIGEWNEVLAKEWVCGMMQALTVDGKPSNIALLVD